MTPTLVPLPTVFFAVHVALKGVVELQKEEERERRGQGDLFPHRRRRQRVALLLSVRRGRQGLGLTSGSVVGPLCKQLDMEGRKASSALSLSHTRTPPEVTSVAPTPPKPTPTPH